MKASLEDLQSRQNRALHVLTLTPFYPHEQDDGSGCFVAEPLDALAESGIQNSVFAVEPWYRGRLHSTPSAPARWLRYSSLPGNIGLPTAGAFLYARIVGAVRELHGKHRIDLVHAHAALPCGHTAMLLHAELGIPYVITVHGLDAFSTTQVSGRVGEWCRRISQHVFRNANRVICVSERVREKVLEGAGGACSTVVVYNGVNPDMFSPPVNPLQGLSVLSVGNLIPIKGHELLLRAIAKISSEFPALTCDIIGSGPEKDRLQKLAAELRIAERVRFAGRQSRAKVAEAMRACTVFALPSRYEGLGCVYLEAMSCGKPAIACRGQGISEVIRDGWNGALVSDNDAHELAGTLAVLLRDEPRRRRIGAAARNTILQGFTLAHQAEHLARIFQESVRECLP